MPKLTSFDKAVKNTKFFTIITGRRCQLAFILFLGLGYWLIPQTVFSGGYRLWAVLFMLSFAASSTCAVKSIKDQMMAGLKSEASVLSLVASLFGLTAIQFCSVNAVLCGSSIGVSFLSMVLPNFFFHFFHKNAGLILILSTLLQLFSLLVIGCLAPSKCSSKNNSSDQKQTID